MQPLSGTIQFVMDQSQVDPVYRLKGRMLGLLMSNSQLPVGLVIGLQFNTVFSGINSNLYRLPNCIFSYFYPHFFGQHI